MISDKIIINVARYSLLLVLVTIATVSNGQYLMRSLSSSCPGGENVFTFTKPGCSVSWGTGGGATIIDQSSSHIRLKWNNPTTNAFVYVSYSSCSSSPTSGTEYYPSFTIAAPNALISPVGPLKVCSTCSQTLTATPVGGTYGWKKDGVLISGASSSTYSASQAGSYSAIVIVSGCSKETSAFVLTKNVAPIPNAGSNQSVTLPALSFQMTGSASDPDGTITTRLWQQTSGPNTATITTPTALTTTVTNFVAGVYKFTLRATDNFGETATSAEAIITVNYPANNFNFVASQAILDSTITTKAAADALTIGSNTKSKTVNYFDGLGRPLQTVAVKASPSQLDMVQPLVYDAYGREVKKYLPFTAGSDGYCKSPLDIFNSNGEYAGVAQPFYSSVAGLIANDTRYFSETTFEASPLNRPLKTYGPGDVWGPVQQNKFISFDYLVNIHGTAASLSSEKVIAWTLNASGKPVRRAVAGATIVTGGYYGSSQLQIKVMLDEHGNAIREYTNTKGQVILKKIQVRAADNSLNSTNDWAMTYYIYDDFDNLRYVLQPELSKAIHKAADTYVVTTADLTNFGFQYKYDARRRMTHKKVPGAGWVYMVYDNRDRLVMTQDSVQRPLKQWLFTKYDTLNRPIVTGLYTHATVQSQEVFSNNINQFKFCESYNGTLASMGYTNTVWPTTNTIIYSANFYDAYAFVTPLINNGNAAITTWNYKKTDIAGLPSYLKMANGQTTGAVSLIMGSSPATYLWTVNYFDNDYRMIQQFNQNHKGGIDCTSNLYDFTKLIQTKTSHANGASVHNIKQRYVYDHTNRVKQVFHTFDTQPEVLLAENSYNELGQLILKKNHSRSGSAFIQNTDYRYNIRGWLSKVNDAASPDVSDLFSMNLRYNSAAPNGAPAQYNGNINEISWKSAGQDVQSYEYYYDTLSRLKQASYHNKVQPLLNGRYNEVIGGITAKGYDLNGNIRKLSRNGKKDATTFGLMDNLTYTYTGNRVTRIDDAVANNAAEEGFRELVKAANEYAYDGNGSMKLDNNKGITAVTYNHLNLPVQVNKGSTNYIVYTYDATGRKLKQQVYGTAPKVTDYLGDYVYENDTLKFISHEEGRIVPDNSVGAPRPWEYQYMLKDHLGNVRVMFSEKTTNTEYKATLETATQTSEQSIFKGYANKSSFSSGNHTSSGTYSQLLNAGNNSQVGLGKSFAVTPGDVFDLEVYAKYEAPTSTNTTVTTLLNTLVSTFALGTGTGAESRQAQTSFTAIFSGGGPFVTSGMWDSGAPRAYLNYILFDENFVLVDFGFDQVSTSAASAHELLALHVKVQKKGYLYVYLSNEQAVQTNVYFDDFKINYHGGVEQVSDYFAFGLLQNSNSFQKQSSLKNPRFYNGKEIQDELNLGWLDYGAREYLPEIGRWNSIDPLSEFYEGISGYNYAIDNPVCFLDPDGRSSKSVSDLIQNAWDATRNNGSTSFDSNGECACGCPGKPPCEEKKITAEEYNKYLKQFDDYKKSKEFKEGVRRARNAYHELETIKQMGVEMAFAITGETVIRYVFIGGKWVYRVIKAKQALQAGVDYLKLFKPLSDFDVVKTLYRGATGSEATSSAIFLTDDAAVAASYVKNGGQVVRYTVSEFALKSLQASGELTLQKGIHGTSGAISTEYVFQGEKLVKALNSIGQKVD